MRKHSTLHLSGGEGSIPDVVSTVLEDRPYMHLSGSAEDCSSTRQCVCSCEQLRVTVGNAVGREGNTRYTMADAGGRRHAVRLEEKPRARSLLVLCARLKLCIVYSNSAVLISSAGIIFYTFQLCGIVMSRMGAFCSIFCNVGPSPTTDCMCVTFGHESASHKITVLRVRMR